MPDRLDLWRSGIVLIENITLSSNSERKVDNLKVLCELSFKKAKKLVLFVTFLRHGDKMPDRLDLWRSGIVLIENNTFNIVFQRNVPVMKVLCELSFKKAEKTRQFVTN